MKYEGIEEIIKSSKFRLHSGNYVYAKLEEVPGLEDCFMLSKDQDEITCIVSEANLPKVKIIERNKDLYRLIELAVSVPFYSVGFLATVSAAIAGKGMNILIVSTYSKDYILVRQEHEQLTLSTLKSLGFEGMADE